MPSSESTTEPTLVSKMLQSPRVDYVSTHKTLRNSFNAVSPLQPADNLHLSEGSLLCVVSLWSGHRVHLALEAIY